MKIEGNVEFVGELTNTCLQPIKYLYNTHSVYIERFFGSKCIINTIHTRSILSSIFLILDRCGFIQSIELHTISVYL